MRRINLFSISTTKSLNREDTDTCTLTFTNWVWFWELNTSCLTVKCATVATIQFYRFLYTQHNTCDIRNTQIHFKYQNTRLCVLVYRNKTPTQSHCTYRQPLVKPETQTTCNIKGFFTFWWKLEYRPLNWDNNDYNVFGERRSGLVSMEPF